MAMGRKPPMSIYSFWPAGQKVSCCSFWHQSLTLFLTHRLTSTRKPLYNKFFTAAMKIELLPGLEWGLRLPFFICIYSLWSDQITPIAFGDAMGSINRKRRKPPKAPISRIGRRGFRFYAFRPRTSFEEISHCTALLKLDSTLYLMCLLVASMISSRAPL